MTQTDSEFLHDVAARVWRFASPKMGFDQGDTDRLYRIARDLSRAAPPAMDREAVESAVQGISDDFMTSETHHPGYVLIPLAKFEQLQGAEQSLATTKTPASVRDAIIAAITKADANFGYSYRLTKMDETGEEHTLFMDGFEPAVFQDREDGYPVIEQRRNAARANAILSTLSADAIRQGEGLPQSVVSLIIAAREAFDTGMLPNDEQTALDKALELFSATVPYENEPATPASHASDGGK
ncbi:MAG TPA: hypothetical protein QF469_07990 [Sphingomonas sanguinis]|uniref:hypothetical protein n=1 Tax=Sphingomonas sanguinis TaxID=33051 RepID=UPI002ABEA685|nr:hypothetical protein [Sphingomonas sanguinis]